MKEYQKGRFFLTMLTSMFTTLSGKRACIFGWAFKANTADTRESLATFILIKLLAARAEVSPSCGLPDRRLRDLKRARLPHCSAHRSRQLLTMTFLLRIIGKMA
jgi:UDP-N-acetyl-D-mannosaminuronate dehydrogenase